MRTISLVNRYKWSFTGNMNPHALAIGDVDNDGDNEFIIGNLNGDLAVFKGKCADETPTFSCKDLGTITCVAVGDVRNNGKNSLICISAEGSAHIFDFRSPLNELAATAVSSMTPAALVAQEQVHQKRQRSSIDASTHTFLSNRISGKEHEREKLSMGKSAWDKPSLTLKVPVNVNKILIADIDGDGLNELVLARTDRILHIYQLTPRLFTSSPSSSNPSTAVPTPAPSSKSNRTQSESLVSPSPSRSASSRSGAPIPAQNMTSSDLCEPRPSSPLLSTPNISQTSLQARPSQSSINTGPSEHLVAKPDFSEKGNWIFTGQITSLAVTRHPERPHEPLLLVAQPGNAFIIIDKDGNWLNHDLTVHGNRTGGNCEMGYQQFGDLALIEGSTWQVATELATGKRGGTSSESPDVIAILSMDGTLAMYDLKTLSLTQHELHVTHKLFNVTAVNLSSPKISDPNSILSGNLPMVTPAFGSMLPNVLEESQAHHFDDKSKRTPLQDDTESILMSTDENRNANTSKKDNKSECYVEDDLFVACAWNGTTYLVDWDAARWKREQAQIGRGRHAGRNAVDTIVEEKRMVEEDGKEHLRMVKFEFEGRVCAFAAGQYAVDSGRNVPCLFYVDFEDQIFVYWDIRISLRPVLGFLDTVGETVLDEVVLAEKYLNKGLIDENGHEIQQDLPDFVHKCMYDIDGLKAQLEEAAIKSKHARIPSMKTTEMADTPTTINDNVKPSEADKTESAEVEPLMEEHGSPEIESSVNNVSAANKKGKKKKKKKH